MYGRKEVLARHFMEQYLSRKEQFLTALHWWISPLMVTAASGDLRIAQQMDPCRPEQMRKYESEGRGTLCHILNTVMCRIHHFCSTFCRYSTVTPHYFVLVHAGNISFP